MSSVAPLSEKLRQAASAGHADHVQELCQLGAKMDADMEGRTALHLASANGHLATVKALIEAGAKVNVRDVAGYSPLHQAATEGHEEIVKLLLKNGCNVDTQDELHGNTALHEAAWKGFSRTLEVLCKNRANVYIKNKGGFTPLHLTCQNGHNQSCRVLLLSACKPDVRNSYGDTPLHTAARYGHAGVLRILISAFCCVSETNKNGDTALHIAAAMGKRKLTKILLEASCDQNICNNQGEKASDIAERKGFTEVFDILVNPPVTLIPVKEKRKSMLSSSKTDPKKREKDSGTSQESSGKAKKDKHKKSKKGHKVHFSTDGVKKGNISPYGCHMYPNLEYFPSVKLKSLPEEPLKKGEQYYADLAGNIKKGPRGLGYMCYCAPFFHHVERKMDANKQELLEHIDHKNEDLKAKLTYLEQRTHDQLFDLNQKMKESLALERAECSERLDRRILRERHELEKSRENCVHSLRSEMQSWGEPHCGISNGYHNGSINKPLKHRIQNSIQILARSKSADMLSETSTNQTSTALHSGTVTDRSRSIRNGHYQKDYSRNFEGNSENCGTKPKYVDTKPSAAELRWKAKYQGQCGLNRDSKSEGDLTSCNTATSEYDLLQSHDISALAVSRDKIHLGALNSKEMKNGSAERGQFSHTYKSTVNSYETNASTNKDLTGKNRYVPEHFTHNETVKRDNQEKRDKRLRYSELPSSSITHLQTLREYHNADDFHAADNHNRHITLQVKPPALPSGLVSQQVKRWEENSSGHGKLPSASSQAHYNVSKEAPSEVRTEAVPLPPSHDGSSFV